MLFHASSVFVGEVADQAWNIIAAVSQRWDADWKNVQAIIEITAKFLFRDHGSEIGIRSCQYPNIDLLGVSAAQPLELLLLQDSEKLRLQLERYVSNFVKKQSSFVRQFKSSDFLSYRSGEGASFVAELSRSPKGIAAQFTFTNAWFLRGLRS